MVMKEAVDLLEEVLTEEQLKMLHDLDYFIAPASTRHHLSVKGGLAQHSLNVTNRMLQMNDKMNYGIKRDWIIIMGMLHDLVKLSYGYEENLTLKGEQHKSIPYKANYKFDIGHGAGSIYLAINELKLNLPVPVASAIYHHMGFEFPRDSYSVNVIKKNPIDMLCVLLLQHGDQLATYVDEMEYD